jgi:SulP family sulfate permease
MVLAGLDMTRTWIVNSYFKTKAKLEWMVAPLIVVLAFTVGMLNAIFLGVAISTFIFVANFYKAGTVKFVGNGLTLRSTVERGVPEQTWLNQNGDLIQILVLQNYLFFGNAQSVFHYIMTMFEEPDVDEVASFTGQSMPLPPVPKYVVIDFTIVTGMDTSAVDILREIAGLCRGHRCKLFFSGLSPSLRSMLVYAKVNRSHEKGPLMFATDLESAIAKAEDGLINRFLRLGEKDESESYERVERRKLSNAEEGFLYALQKIDEQVGDCGLP